MSSQHMKTVTVEMMLSDESGSESYSEVRGKVECGLIEGLDVKIDGWNGFKNDDVIGRCLLFENVYYPFECVHGFVYWCAVSCVVSSDVEYDE